MKTQQRSLIPTTLRNSTDRPYLEGYFDNYSDYDHYIGKMWGRLILDTYPEKEEVDTEVIEDIDTSIRALILKNKEKYEHLFELMLIEYDPISNYDRVESSTHTEGSRQDSQSLGSHTDTENLGASSGTTTNSAQHSYTEDKVVGDNATTPQIRERTDANSDQYTNSFNNNAVVNTTQYGAQSNSSTKGQQVNTIESHISGNVGVTTSQEMALSEANLWDNLNYLDELFKDIIEVISIPIYEEG